MERPWNGKLALKDFLWIFQVTSLNKKENAELQLKMPLLLIMTKLEKYKVASFELLFYGRYIFLPSFE